MQPQISIFLSDKSPPPACSGSGRVDLSPASRVSASCLCRSQAHHLPRIDFASLFASLSSIRDVLPPFSSILIRSSLLYFLSSNLTQIQVDNVTMTTPGLATSTLRHTVVSLGPPHPLTTQSCTSTIDEEGYGYGCLSTPACSSPLVLSTDTTNSGYMGSINTVFLCVNPPTSSSSNPGGLMSTAPSPTTSVQSSGSLSTSGIAPSRIASVSLHHTSLTEPLSTVSSTAAGSGTTSTGTGTSSSVSPTASSSVAAGMNANFGESSLVGLVALCWMGVWGWRTLRARL